MSKVALPAELPQQGAFQDTATLNKHTSIDRLGRHLHIRIAWKRASKPARDLLRRPLPRQLRRDRAPESGVRRQPASLRTLTPGPGVSIGWSGAIQPAPLIPRH